MAAKDSLAGCGIPLAVLSIIALILVAEFAPKSDSTITALIVICLVGLIGVIMFFIGIKD